MNAMIDHEELERVKKLEDVEWLKSKNVVHYALQISPLFEHLIYEIWVQRVGEKMNVIQGTDLLLIKNKIFDYLNSEVTNGK